MTTIWFAVLFLSLSWYPLTNVYEPTNIHYHPPVWFSIVAIAASLIFVFFARSRSNRGVGESAKGGSLVKDIADVPWKIVSLFVASLLFVIVIPFPYNISAIFLLVSLLFAVVNLKVSHRHISAASDSFFVCGLILAVQSALLPFFFLFASHFHRVDFIGAPLSFLLNLLGAHSSFSDGYLIVQSADKVYSFVPSYDALGIYPSLNILAGGFVLFLLFRSSRRYYAFLPFAILLYMVFRYVGLVFIFTELERVNLFWRLDITTISLLPLPFVLGWTLRKAFDSSSELNPQPLLLIREGEHKVPLFLRDGLRVGSIAAAMVVFVVSCVLFFGFSDPGTKKAGRILIDEGHSDWEWTTQPFDTTWYGERSTYNYYSMAEYLKHFYKVDQKTDELSENLLKNYDILFIKPPTRPFSEEEISSITEFVNRGGGLLLIGDHTNVFGITTNLNPIAERFGMGFQYNAQYDLDGELSDYDKPKILPHPTVQSLPPFMFATSCMLDVPLTAENSIIGYGIKGVDADYSQKNFFPKNTGTGENCEFGAFVQAAGMPYGKGRVFLLGDSTPWSNFYMFIPGKPELMLGILEWLNRENSFWEVVRLVSLITGLLSLLVMIGIALRAKRGMIVFTALSVGFLVLPLSVLVLESFNHHAYLYPEPHTKFTRVNFEAEHSRMELPVRHITMNFEESYHTFYIWLQRLNLVPCLKQTYMSALSDGDAVVIINPQKAFRQDEIDSTKRFLAQGGKLLIMDDPRYTHHVVVNQLLSSLGEQMTAQDTLGMPVALCKTSKSADYISSSSAGEVNGGTPILYARAVEPYNDMSRFVAPPEMPQYHRLPYAKNVMPAYPRNGLTAQRAPIDTAAHPVASFKNVGKGVFVVLATSSIFTDREMGSNAAIPSTNMRRIYDLEYWLFQKQLGLK
jgi:hypothetical protein